MAALYNGGDDHYSANGAVGGSGNISNITEAEIAVIVITVVGVVAALVLVFYCRILRARRDMDMENKARQERMQDMDRANQPQELGDAMELGGQKRPVSGATCDTVLGGNNAKSDESESSHRQRFESDKPRKPPLRHYIHWKNPQRETFSQGGPNRDPSGNHPIVPNPAYFV
ncbi:hypothetical protein QBC43DRAFT_262749 [Cladorrhinum sp. PSN259]|nr:hypothetical protein QBC43DRAFT_262749 [Cladorrhinum sp. PSN259]